MAVLTWQPGRTVTATTSWLPSQVLTKHAHRLINCVCGAHSLLAAALLSV